MNGLLSSVPTVEAIRDGLSPALADKIDVLICPPATLIAGNQRTASLACHGVPVLRVSFEDLQRLGRT
jgi:hypothetical protein